MLLVVNIGNSNIRFGIFKDEECTTSWVVNTKPYKGEDELYSNFKVMYQNYNIKVDEITDIAIGSVVPILTYPVRRALGRIHGIKTILINNKTNPSGLKPSAHNMGTDLFANAVYAQEKYDGTKVVVDFGTALTLTCINPEGEVLGVIIAPGVITSMDALINSTAQLADIELRTPHQILGKNTQDCMQSGIIYGFLSMVEGLIDRIKKEINIEKSYVISTGGMGHLFEPLTDYIDIYDKYHTLKGIRQLYLNKKNA